MNNKVDENFSKIKFSIYYIPTLLILIIVGFLYQKNALDKQAITTLQKDSFLYLNAELGQYPTLMDNCTQFGDALIFMSILTILIIYSPKLWEALISASLLSAIFAAALKKIFRIPRPAAIYTDDPVIIIGQKLTGHNSFPSGHTITIFTIITIIMFAFMPKKLLYKILWSSSLTIIGLCLSLTRLGVGAHYPLDVCIGAIVGYVAGVTGIFINQKHQIWSWICNKRYYPIFIVLFACCGIVIIFKILNANLYIYYIALLNLIVSLYLITKSYVKK